MSLRIAIPEPTSSDTAYNQRSLPQYTAALQSAGAIPTIVPLHERPDRIARLLANVQGILLPGSGFDIDPQDYGAQRLPACAPPDPARAAVDQLLLQDAFDLHKPVLAICYGVQSLNVWRNGSLFQDLPTETATPVNHAPGRTVTEAHPIEITPGSRLASFPADTHPQQVNSSHHQALRVPGRNLRVTAICPTDGVIEAVELDSPDHYVLGVQWHPERTYLTSALSREIFASFIHAVSAWKPRPLAQPVAAS